MATDKAAIWRLGELKLWHSPTGNLDATWRLGEAYVLDEYVSEGQQSILPILMQSINQFNGGTINNARN